MIVAGLARCALIFLFIGCSTQSTAKYSAVHVHRLIDDLIKRYVSALDPEEEGKKLGELFSLDPAYFLLVMQRESWTPRMAAAVISSPPSGLLDKPCAQAIVLSARNQLLKPFAKNEYVFTVIKISEKVEHSTKVACKLFKE